MNKLSVIVPVYNGEKDIERCLFSLFNCGLDVDIIVVDSSSTDNTYNIVNKLKESHKNISLYKIANTGIADSRNFALTKVNTPYFTFLDSDDTVNSGYYLKAITLMEKDDSDILFANFDWVYEDNSHKEAKDINYKDKKDILTHMFATLWNKIYRTSWFKEVGLSFPSGRVYEDASLLYRLVPYMDKVSYLDTTAVNYMQRQGSITHTFDLKINDMIAVFEDIYNFYRTHDLLDEYQIELEYLFTRFFFGNSYLRAVRIENPKLRKETLEKGYNFIINSFPSFRTNPYLKQGGKKNFYYSKINHFMYFFNVPLFRLAYKLGVLK